MVFRARLEPETYGYNCMKLMQWTLIGTVHVMELADLLEISLLCVSGAAAGCLASMVLVKSAIVLRIFTVNSSANPTPSSNSFSSAIDLGFRYLASCLPTSNFSWSAIVHC